MRQNVDGIHIATHTRQRLSDLTKFIAVCLDHEGLHPAGEVGHQFFCARQRGINKYNFSLAAAGGSINNFLGLPVACVGGVYFES